MFNLNGNRYKKDGNCYLLIVNNSEVTITKNKYYNALRLYRLKSANNPKFQLTTKNTEQQPKIIFKKVFAGLWDVYINNSHFLSGRSTVQALRGGFLFKVTSKEFYFCPTRHSLREVALKVYRKQQLKRRIKREREFNNVSCC